MSSTTDTAREQFMAPGWYVDPAGTQVKRRWDGYGWTDEVIPAGTIPAPWITPAPAQEAAAAKLWARNSLSFIALIVCALYLVVDQYSNFVVFGLVPISLSIQAFRRREPLWFAAAIAAAAVVAAPFVLFNH
jgi:hypothetical protein